jgi:hypothetical protein
MISFALINTFKGGKSFLNRLFGKLNKRFINNHRFLILIIIIFGFLLPLYSLQKYLFRFDQLIIVLKQL